MRCAIVLGGGRSWRMGRDKLTLEVGETTLLGAVCAAAAGWADRVAVAGPPREIPMRVEFISENPPFGGPVAGIAAVVAEVSADEYLLLAGDLAAPEKVVAVLSAAVMGSDGVVLRDESGLPQWLAGRYRGPALREAIAALGAARDVSVRHALGGLTVAEVPVLDCVAADIDTPEDVKKRIK